MRAIMLMFDSLNREFLPNYGCDWTKMPNFERLSRCCTTFDNFYGGSMPCMPARRELHTGRYNFLHTFWTPMHPYDDSVISRMKAAKIYTHIATDHFHYWEDGGSGYLTKFDSHEMVRGQQGDPWKPQVQWPSFPDTLSRRKTGENWRHDWVNRSFIDTEDKMPQKRTFDNGIDFINRSLNDDQWFLQIEAFDPHEPFYTQQSYKDLYPHDYHGKNLDWPDYGKNSYGEEATEHVRMEYAALMSMCDHYLGRLLDVMDANDMWKDTMLIVNTDHGFMLGEKEWMGKNSQPFYNELVHSPFFIHDPRAPHPGERRNALAQTVDIVPTLAEYFGIEPPQFMDGHSLTPAIRDDSPIREGALFGICGGHVNVTDGRYVYMHAPVRADNKPLYEYTLMPMHMNAPYKPEELTDVSLTNEFAFTKGAMVMKMPATTLFNAYWYGTMLFDLQNDPQQAHPIQNPEVQKRLIKLMRQLMQKNDAPMEQYERLGIPQSGEITDDMLAKYNRMDVPIITDAGELDEKANKAAAIFISNVSQDKAEKLKQALRADGKKHSADDVLQIATEVSSPMLANAIRNYL
ncbi:MAG: sulfatase [Oscillospiraceae bacterium]